MSLYCDCTGSIVHTEKVIVRTTGTRTGTHTLSHTSMHEIIIGEEKTALNMKESWGRHIGILERKGKGEMPKLSYNLKKLKNKKQKYFLLIFLLPLNDISFSRL